ncbi:hypothetical protein Dsin_021808 [Dipteronia sinensis]|uniref:Uncharacterized protein n=1 Tax=Dipteronia sinensis TaxID=43782 RepID=A0AAE0A0G8_9ROSI|nr:hypothetical protein Dsin_021808 [Dipteronia sinensis]
MVECLICTQNWLQAKHRTSQLEDAIMHAQNDDSSLENLQFNEETKTELEKLIKTLVTMPRFDAEE